VLPPLSLLQNSNHNTTVNRHWTMIKHWRKKIKNQTWNLLRKLLTYYLFNKKIILCNLFKYQELNEIWINRHINKKLNLIIDKNKILLIATGSTISALLVSSLTSIFGSGSSISGSGPPPTFTTSRPRSRSWSTLALLPAVQISAKIPGDRLQVHEVTKSRARALARCTQFSYTISYLLCTIYYVL